MSQLTLKGAAVRAQDLDDALLVTWQHPVTRTYYLMGQLEQDLDGAYTFAYFPCAEQKVGFRTIPGFADTARTYRSSVLFPFFSGRIMAARRPDRPEWLKSLGLSSDAGPFEILGRSLGHRMGDTFELYGEPAIDLVEKTMAVEIPVHGLRYFEAGRKLLETGGIEEGTTLDVRPEPDNKQDPRALAVHAPSGEQLGYVPAPILDYMERLGYLGKPATATAVHVNPRQFGHHQRIIMSAVWQV